MGKPKKQTSSHRTGDRRAHHKLKLARTVNSLLAHAGKHVRAFTTKRESAKKVKAA